VPVLVRSSQQQQQQQQRQDIELWRSAEKNLLIRKGKEVKPKSKKKVSQTKKTIAEPETGRLLLVRGLR
jgi:hypothetical protein